MSDAVVVLLVIQAVLLVGILGSLMAMMSLLKATSRQANELLEEVNRTLTNDVKPALAEARRAIARTEVAAEAATETLHAAAPVVSAASQVAGVINRVNPVWLDALRLGIGVLGVVRSRRKSSKTSTKEITNAGI